MSSDKITRKEHRDLGVSFVSILGHHQDQTTPKSKDDIKMKGIVEEPSPDPDHASSAVDGDDSDGSDDDNVDGIPKSVIVDSLKT